MEQVLRHLDAWDRLHGQGPQRRGPCPVHARGNKQNRSFSVNLEKNLFRCLDPQCGAQGNVLDLWAAFHRLPLYRAALHLAETFHVSVQSPNREEATRKSNR
ncbi:MAG: hypothetical protein HY000_01565 [Planctomycetes bacterium]|nr:hypothetical protein [Planctomycetota bacterium]